MGPITAQLLEELGYDPDDGVPQLSDMPGMPGMPGMPDMPNRPNRGDVRDMYDLGRGNSGNLPELTIGAVIAARIGARRVAVARLGSGRLVVVDDECPHDGGRISDGFVEGERLVCARHGWELEARNGRCERVCKLRE